MSQTHPTSITPAPSTALDQNSVQAWLANLPFKLGVNSSYLLKMASDHGLTLEDLDTIAGYHDGYNISVWKINELLRGGFGLDVIEGLVEAREDLTTLKEGRFERYLFVPSLQPLIKLLASFPETNIDDLSDTAREVESKVTNLLPWVRSLDQAVNIVCDIAKAYSVTSIETVFDILENGHEEED